jgi:hypothetical protein
LGEANKKANKKRGCPRAFANSLERECTLKPLIYKANWGFWWTLADGAEHARI